MNEFKDKRVFIIGGSSGIGFATLEKFLYLGSRVAVMDINIQNLTSLSWNPSRHEPLFLQGNVRSKLDINNAVDHIINKWDGIDILIYSAGIYPDHLLLEMEEEEWDEVLEVNLKGGFLACQAVAKSMKEQGIKGHIITISSGSYLAAREGSGHYCASKAGLVMLTKVLALELAQFNIQVNSVAPGLVDNEKLDRGYIESFSQRIPFKRPAKPVEISSVIQMIASSSNTYMTGQVIVIDGGLSSGHMGLPPSNRN